MQVPHTSQHHSANSFQPPQQAFLRLKQIIGDPNAHPPIPALIPVSRSTFWAWVKSGKAPQPIKLSTRVTAWRTEEIYLFIKRLQKGVH